MAEGPLAQLIEDRPKLIEDRPMLLQADRPVASAIRQNIPNDPEQAIVEPTVLNQWKDADLPFRGEVRQRISQRLAEDVRRRRTINGISERAATALVTPIFSELTNMATTRIRSRLSEQAQRAVNTQSDSK